MAFDPTLAAVRFGFGLSPVIAPPASVAQMMALLRGPDVAAAAYVIPRDDAVDPSLFELQTLNRARRDARGTDRAEATETAFQDRRRDMQVTLAQMAGTTLARAITAEDAFRERLVRFWADHFTVRARNALAAHLVTPMVETAIRPHVAGRFADMLVAAVTHPVMLSYLDQTQSMGPNSVAAQRRDRGLNENLAREVLELHTVGVNGPYGQADVRELAELLTGLSANSERGLVFQRNYTEPGAETVLGQTYSAEASLETILAGLRGIAAHPATAHHIAQKLAIHFVSDTPDAGLVAALEQTFVATNGDLALVSEVLLSHPAAWASERAKVKPPFDFVASSLRALNIPPEVVLGASLRDIRRYLILPLTAMGQPWEQPSGPNGWPEQAQAWVTPQGIAARIEWAMTVPAVALDTLPDPRDFVRTALGPLASGALRFAAEAAETQAEGVGVILASPDFQRR